MSIETPRPRTRRSLSLTLIALLFLSSLPAHAQTTRWYPLTAFRSEHDTSLDGVVQPGEWNDTLLFYDHFSTLMVAFKQNTTGLLSLVTWSEPSPCNGCYAALEFGYLNNTGYTGTAQTPITEVILSPSLKGNVDEAISTGGSTSYVEEQGYRTQSVCGLNYDAGRYTAECYRPFDLVNPSPQDLRFTLGSTVELGLATGNFSSPGSQLATDMSTYVLIVSNETYLSETTTMVVTTTTRAPIPLYHDIEVAVLIVGLLVLAGLAILATLWRPRSNKTAVEQSQASIAKTSRRFACLQPLSG